MARCSDILALAALLLIACGDAAEPLDELPRAQPDAIHAWLVGGGYTEWRAESGVHPGLNGSGRRVFLNDVVSPELSPVGAAAVRELYDGAGPGARQIGWSVLLKTADDGGGVEDWYFYETFDLNGGEVAAAGAGTPGCAFCHAAAPDVIRSVLPLR